jgi:hypothetical protein
MVVISFGDSGTLSLSRFTNSPYSLYTIGIIFGDDPIVVVGLCVDKASESFGFVVGGVRSRGMILIKAGELLQELFRCISLLVRSGSSIAKLDAELESCTPSKLTGIEK